MNKYNIQQLYIGTIIKNIKQYRVGNRIVLDGESVRGDKKTIFAKINDEDYLRIGNQRIYRIAKNYMQKIGILESGFISVKQALNCQDNFTLTEEQIMQLEELYNENKKQAENYVNRLCERER